MQQSLNDAVQVSMQARLPIRDLRSPTTLPLGEMPLSGVLGLLEEQDELMDSLPLMQGSHLYIRVSMPN
jgi:hypothetical protein